MKRLVRAVRVALELDRSEDLASRRRDAEAMQALVRVHRLFGSEVPSAKVWVEVSLLTALAAVRLGDGSLALAAAEAARSAAITSREKLSAPDRAYLRAYSEALINYCTMWRDQPPIVERVDLSGIDLARVSRRFRQKFVLLVSGTLVEPVRVAPWSPP